MVQLSVATGDIPCAAVNPDASPHSRVTFKAPGVVVQAGAVRSTIRVVAGDSLHANTEAVPATVMPQSAATTYLVLIL